MKQLRRRKMIITVIGIVLLILLLRGCIASSSAAPVVFTVSRSASTTEIETKLAQQSFVRGRVFFGLAMLLHGGYGSVRPGGYIVNGTMGSWQLAGILTGDPPLKWVVIPEGLRREQIADRLAAALGWDAKKRNSFLLADVAKPYGLSEGFYFPDTYLIPVDENETQVVKRFVDRFNANFAPYVQGFQKANIKDDTAIKIASIIQREAAGAADMPLIAGVLWNRLLKKMPLEVDATLQYARGDTGSGYWAPISIADKQIDSPFNTYEHAGLPPEPISNPGLDAIEAVLHPQDTTCLFYLHDQHRQIHCADTYEQHRKNIDTYLRNGG